MLLVHDVAYLSQTEAVLAVPALRLLLFTFTYTININLNLIYMNTVTVTREMLP